MGYGSQANLFYSDDFPLSAFENLNFIPFLFPSNNLCFHCVLLNDKNERIKKKENKLSELH